MTTVRLPYMVNIDVLLSQVTTQCYAKRSKVRDSRVLDPMRNLSETLMRNISETL